MPRYRLTDPNITSIHMVDKGDNPEAHFAMFKAAPEDMISDQEIDEIIKEEQETTATEPEPVAGGVLGQWMETGRRLFGGGSLNSISNLHSTTDTVKGEPLQWSTVTTPTAAIDKVERAAKVTDPVERLEQAAEEIAKAEDDNKDRKKTSDKLRRLKEVRETLQNMIDSVGHQATTEAVAEATAKGADMEPLDPKVLEGLDENVRKHIEDLQSKVEKSTKEDEPEQDPIYKGMNSQQVAFFKAQNEIINTMKREREEREYIEKSAKLDALPVNPGELGPVLRKVAKGQANAEDEKYLMDLFGTLNAMQKNANIFGEAGSIVRGNTGSAESELMAKAAAVAAQDGTNKEVALAKVSRDPANQELVKRYYEEVHN